ncbi:dihydropteroate synthase [Drepanopeziza brunnea f. sp. 'multigermtubi' MB_m1]|uniref:Dihydropteroate synthase n=1 Tax=Marssonina brunnea f. sp. multigermtubi (strain MB_m1) TaxID=1072389 RepID=K1WTG3_MARBU|nr:dihydropteroate synthase [Drepanopeziza brunnea f. sp. 'multigermtubi' MB_m1]EKD11888.1 dihydropteroate synthase [Drepanopeziza brunnea f. sp. 'multigermtubi' MB_m1]
MPPPLLTPHALTTLSGDPHTLIRLTHLRTTLPISTDAWGRPSISASIPQPVLLSCALSLRHPFTTASSSDTVAASTVHYGTLSKAILAACEAFRLSGEGTEKGMGMRDLVAWVLFRLTGQHILAAPEAPQGEHGSGNGNGDENGNEERVEPLLKPSSLKLLELEVSLPKASLLGSGVSLTGSVAYGGDQGGGEQQPSAFSMVLKLHELRVPTLVGVNACERLAKQMVYVGIEMQRWDWPDEDGYARLEEVVVKVMSNVSFSISFPTFSFELEFTFCFCSCSGRTEQMQISPWPEKLREESSEETAEKKMRVCLSIYLQRLTKTPLPPFQNPQSTEESSFQTLEALAEHLITRLIRYIVIPHLLTSLPHSTPTPAQTPTPSSTAPPGRTYPRIKIALSKPTAVTFADAPTVEMAVDADPGASEIAARVWGEVGGEGGRKVPFPLMGRLDEWIEREGGCREG